MDRKHDESFDNITLLNMEQILKYLNISQWTYYKLIRSGELPRVPMGRRRLVRLVRVKEYLEKAETRKEKSNVSEFGF